MKIKFATIPATSRASSAGADMRQAAANGAAQAFVEAEGQERNPENMPRVERAYCTDRRACAQERQ